MKQEMRPLIFVLIGHFISRPTINNFVHFNFHVLQRHDDVNLLSRSKSANSLSVTGKPLENSTHITHYTEHIIKRQYNNQLFGH